MVRKPSQSPLTLEAPTCAAAFASLPVGHRMPVIPKEAGKRCALFAETAGETAAECAAICCCCPCGMVNLLVVVVVKLPAALVRRALRRSRKRQREKAAILRRRVAIFDDDLTVHCGSLLAMAGSKEVWPARSPSEEMSELEKVMWANFYGAGFWRSPSQRE